MQQVQTSRAGVISVGLVGCGKAGCAVARVLSDAPGVRLCWVARQHASKAPPQELPAMLPLIGLDPAILERRQQEDPVDALIDFSAPAAAALYGEWLRRHRLALVSAISAYSEADLQYLRTLGKECRVLCSPNITLGINFLILAARLLRCMAPEADVEIIEQHFREKPEISGTASKIAASLALDPARITSLRVGGIVGQHEVVFGFPHQTVRLSHDAIRREAFGTGALFALRQLIGRVPDFYTLDQLLMEKVRAEFQQP